MSLASPVLELSPETPAPASGQFVIMQSLSWQRYEDLARDFDGTRARLTYLDGTLEIMAPPISEEHESRSRHIGHLVSEFCLHQGIRFWSRGSRTLLLFQQAGIEPDEQFSFRETKEFPDLTVEIGITSGGLNKLTVYERFQIPEVWIWQADQLHVFRYDPATGHYTESQESTVLPGIHLPAVARCARIEESSEAILEFRKSLE